MLGLVNDIGCVLLNLTDNGILIDMNTWTTWWFIAWTDDTKVGEWMKQRNLQIPDTAGGFWTPDFADSAESALLAYLNVWIRKG
jgi:hypothetical protein